MKHVHLFVFLLTIVLHCSICSVSGIAQNKIKHTLFLAGNTSGQDMAQQEKFISALSDLDHPYSFIHLGNFSSYETENDNLKFSFFPENYPKKETALLFAMGPKEWATGKKHVKKVINSLHDRYKEHPVYTPDWGCPGPKEVELNDQLTVLILDTYWWLYTGDVRFGKCGMEEEKDVFVWLQDALRRNNNKTVIVATHHPIQSYGPHGGSLPLFVDILGFPYSLYRNTIGSRNDLAHPNYKNLIEQFKAILKQFPNVIYASANEKNMQYFQSDSIHHIISGSLVKQTYVNTRKTEFGSSQAGISRIDLLENGNVMLHFFTLERGPEQAVFSKLLFTKTYKEEQDILEERAKLFQETTHTTFASKQYLATDKYKKWMGENYREIWATPIEARIFDITKERNGLTILKRGGGQQTKSVRLETDDGRQYVLRSLEKFAEGAVPDEMKRTFAKDIVQDQISASNPYSALPAAVLAEHAGIFHTNPEVVFIPPDPLFEHFKEDMKSGLFLYEERPAGNRSDVASFGNSKKIVSTDEVLEKIKESEDHQVDQSAVLKARLLDIYINDWDRHDDQWRWASFKENGKTIYRPIPRDRDQTFFVNQGILPGIASKDFILPKIQNFQPRTKNVIGLGFNARYFDRTFLTQMEWQDWSKATDTLMGAMTEEVIDEAMDAFPEEVRELCADTTKSILLARKTYMKEMANELYMFLSKKVNVLGTEKRDLFEINRKNNQQTEVTVWHLKKDDSKGKQIFHRTFYTLETEEIICYGFDGEDQFVISGTIDHGPIVRIIGGQDKDEVHDSSNVKGKKKLNKIYDLQKSTVTKGGRESRKILSNNKIVHEYDRKYFKDDVGIPLASLGYNADDGVYVGYGRTSYIQKFRRDIKSSVLADYAIKTSAFNIKYRFESLSTNNGYDYLFGLDVSGPNYTTNYYGLGNNTENTYEDKDYKYFQTKQRRYLAGVGIQKRFGKSVWARYDEQDMLKDHSLNEHKIALGLQWRLMNTQNREDKFISNFEENDLNEENLGRKQYLILNSNYTYTNVNKDFRPSRGFIAKASASQYVNIEGDEPDFTKINGSLVTYLSFNKYARIVYAFRLGGEKVFGDFYFHDAAILDGKTNLRGYRQTRFYGHESLYFNAEARFKLLDFKNYLLTGDVGLVVFNDVGRVWYKNEESNKWHNGYGAGIWISPFKMAIFSTTLNHSKEETLIQLKFSYLF